MSISNKHIFITGGTGSLGQILTKKLLADNNMITVYSRDEGKQALIYGQSDGVKCVIGDIRDFDKLTVSIKRAAPDYIIHTAALKRIDDMEFHPDECVKTNINGSENVARAALEHNVERCILISTDKACLPVNVYGSSKFIAERIFSNYDFNSTSTIFASVRYGNVIASRGSFIPLWVDMINNKQPLKVTSENMTRFLFTLEDAANTVLTAMVTAVGGEVFIPQLDSYTLRDCIEALSVMLNTKPEEEIIGLRPGEKLHEDMLAVTELDFTYEVPNQNLLQIRPQCTNKEYQKFKKYTGLEFNSKLWVNNNITELMSLIKRGLL